jgi:type I restriction enzyme S subunit
MIDDLKPYPQYKDTRLPWLATIPAHWEIRRNGRLFAQRNETGFPDLPILEVSLKTGVRVRDFNTSSRKQVMSDRQKYKCARHGDIAYNMMRLWQGAVGVAPVDGLVSPAYVVARPLPETQSRYYEYLFRTDACMNEVNRFSRGIVSDRNRLYWEDFKQMPSPFPPPAEQGLIARFLDHLDRRVRRYIRAKRQIIDLLNEQKQAIIHRAVTRGLDPNVRLKPSGADWLGDVPEHWRVLKIKQVAHVNPGRSEAVRVCDPAELVVFLPMEQVSTEGDVDSSMRRPIREVWQGFTCFRRNDVVIAKITPCFENGKGACLNNLPTEIGFGTTEFIVLRAGAELTPEYLYQLIHLASFRRLGVESMTGAAGQQRVSPNFVANFSVPVSPTEEQHKIARHVEAEAVKFRDAVGSIEKETALLREYRTRLIADVVIGKLDVREAAACLPDERDEMERGDETDVLVDADDGIEPDAVPQEADA